ncbi:adenylate/guanylate cyclase domain-containing protein [Jiella sp. M17.18]|uniref:adenylate/guanylate cyclase domain-containing protein n=1 Tax=Jiella sp. M17.18 TaxID=3234247 RepID=UPI0034DED355
MAPIRRLAAILSMDVEDYSRLVETDETAVLAALSRAFDDRIRPTIGQFGGEVFKTVGDGLLAEFSSPVSAVNWAARFQRSIAAEEGDKALPIRIGIVLGDVVVARDDRFGAGVNLAARVQELSPAGGMAISRGVFEYLTGRTDLYFTDIGLRPLKGLAERQRIWIWNPKVVHAGRSRGLVVPDPATHPSLAILPFDHLAADEEGISFVTGMVEEITASLSRVKEFLVIAHQSAAAFVGPAVDIRAIAAEFGVRYILRGTVRFSGRRMRVSLHLIDGETALQIWTDRIEAQIDDAFKVQDEIAERVSGALHPTIRQAEVERSARKPPGSLAAYDLTMRALPHLWAHRREENERAISLIEEALALDETYGRAAAIGAWANAQHIVYNWTDDLFVQRAKGRALLRDASGRIETDPLALTAAATAIMLIDGDLERANALVDRALDLDVNHAWAWTRRGFARVYAGLADEAFACFERAVRLSPRDPFSFNSLIGIGLAHFASGRAAEASRWTRRALAEKSGMTWPLRDLATFLAAAGEVEEARAAMDEFLAARPAMTVSVIRDALHFMNPSLLDRYVSGLVAAGLPEETLRPMGQARPSA